jgi:hypothetical protein
LLFSSLSPVSVTQVSPFSRSSVISSAWMGDEDDGDYGSVQVPTVLRPAIINARTA